MQTQFLYLIHNKVINNFIMLKNRDRSATYKETMTAEMEVYLELSSHLELDRYTIKATVVQNDVEKEALNYSPPDDRSSEKEYKQLPTTFNVTMRFQVKIELVVQIIHRETRQLFGKVEYLTVNELFSSRRSGVVKKIMSGEKELAKIFLHYESKEEETQKIILNIESEEIKAKSACCYKESYYLTITKRLYGRELLIYKSQYSTKSPSDSFPRIEISSRKLCNNVKTQDFFFDFKNSKDDTLIGSARCSMADLQRSSVFYVQNGKLNNGRIRVKHQRMERQYQFKQFFTSGMQMALVVGIDFTASNGSFTEKQSLHFFTESQKSFYEIALQSVCGILLDYDYDKKVPVYGFGAKIKYKEQNSGNKTSDFFPLTGLKKHHHFIDVDGIIKGYRACLPFLTLFGPTNLAPIIKQSMIMSRKMKDERKEYMILLLLTDGDLDDYDQVADLIVECSHLPISIIIIGITKDRNQTWPIMRKLDNNDLQLTNHLEKKAERDVVKFVEFMRCCKTPGLLEKQVLEELPTQVEEYHRLVNKVPADYLRFLDQVESEAQSGNEREEFEPFREKSMAPIKNQARLEQEYRNRSSPIKGLSKKSRKMQPQQQRFNHAADRNKNKEKAINPEKNSYEQIKKQKTYISNDIQDQMDASMIKIHLPMASKYQKYKQQQQDKDYQPGRQYTPDD